MPESHPLRKLWDCQGDAKALGTVLRDWGVPTAASVVVTRAAKPRFKTIIAAGGVGSGIDVARALALGADAGGIARPVLQAFTERGADGARAFLAQVKREAIERGMREVESRIEADMDPYVSARQMDTDEIVELGELRGYLAALVEMSYQNTGYRRIKNPRIWTMHDLAVLTGGIR